MTLQEFSLEFDILYNNVTSNSAPPLDEYEKSVFLTMAQFEIVKELYSGRNPLGLAVETNEEVRQYLNGLIKYSNVDMEKSAQEYEIPIYTITRDRNSYISILREWIVVTEDNKPPKVIPVYTATQDTVFSILNNPFKGVTSKRAIKVEGNNKIDIYYTPSNSSTLEFKYSYLAKPTPIILENINTSEYLTIDGEDVYEGKNCILPEVLHGDILKRAVQLAKQTYVGQTQE